MHNLIFGPAIFYDIPEYLHIVTTTGFFQSVVLGHFPIHPVFMAILWFLIRFLPVNVIAMVFGIASIFFLSKISKKAIFIYALFPAILIININLMIESVLLFFYILALHFLVNNKKAWFLIAIFLMVGIHLEAVFWIPTLFLVPDFLDRKINQMKFIKTAVVGILLSLAFYLILYFISGRTFSGSGEQLMTYFSSGLARMIRNIWLSLSTGFGSLTVFIVSVLIFLKGRRKQKLTFFLLMVIFGLVAANWQGDFMVRRVAFIAVPFAIIIAKYLPSFWWIPVLYLAPIAVLNILLYAGGDPFFPPQSPPGQVFVETHYLKPFTKYNGTVLFIGESDLSVIDGYLASGKRVFLSSQGVTAPYRLLVGNNYHITSLGKIGNSESRFLFEKYKVAKFNNVYELLKYNGKISPSAGEPVIFYGNDFWSRLSRRRIDYGDVALWIWSLAVGHKDPTGWTYKDATGAWVYPQFEVK